MHTLLYASFNHDAFGRWVYFNSLLQIYTSPTSHLLNWLRSDLISGMGGGETERWCCDGLLLHIVSGWLSLWLCHCQFSQLFVMVLHLLEGDCRDLIGSDPERLISYLGMRKSVRVLMYLSLVWVQVIIWRATVVFYFFFWELSSASDGFFTCQYGW